MSSIDRNLPNTLLTAGVSASALYASPLWYDIAFQYRDIVKECDFLESCCDRFGGGKPRSILDAAFGSGNHLLEFARRGLDCHGVDLNGSMAGYVTAKALQASVPVSVITADMRKFALPVRVDLAYCMLDSFRYLLDDRDLSAHLDCISSHLRQGGLYVVELSHPRDYSTDTDSARNRWGQTRDGVNVEMSWVEQHACPGSGVVDSLVTMCVNDGENVREFREIHRQRIMLKEDIERFAGRREDLELVAMFGDLDPAQMLDETEKSRRMVFVLRKKEID